MENYFNDYSITFRKLTSKDYPAMEKLIDILWNIPRRKKNDPYSHLSRLCIYDDLRRCSFAKAAFIGRRMIGLILGRLMPPPARYRHPQKICRPMSWNFKPVCRRLKHTLWLQRNSRGRTYFKSFSLFTRMDRSLLAASNETYDGELIYVAVDPQFRHQSIAAALLLEFHHYMQSHGARQIYVFTDSACSHTFYQRQNFSPSVKAQWPQKPFTFYLYKYTYAVSAQP